MTFIHKNVNSALLMLITFISVALVTATVYSVEAFDSINEAYAEKAMEAEALAIELAEKQAMTDSLQQTAQLTQERENALAEMLEKQRQTAQQQTEQSASQDVKLSSELAKQVRYSSGPYNPYRKATTYWGWVPRKTYVY